MANIDRPDGFTPINLDWSRVHRYYKDATAGIIGVGDPVIRVVSSSDPKGGPEIVRATTGAAITGVVVAIEPDPSRPRQLHLAAADSGYVLVADHPSQEYEVQEVSGGTALAVTQIGKHIDSVTAINASTTTGRSQYEIDNAAVATDNTWIIMRKVDRPGNDVGENCRWIVKANLHTESNASASNVTEI